MSGVDRMERLVNLLVALLDTKRPLTREELRQRVGGYSDDNINFHRNFERDKELLRQMGIPIVAEVTDRTSPDALPGYRVPRDLYELPDAGLDEDELIALKLAVSAVALDGSAQGAATTALWKLGGASGPRGSGDGPSSEEASASPLLPTAGVALLADVPADDRVSALFGCVAERRVARFEYNGVARQVDPWRLSYRQGRWYLAGYDQARQAERLFRVDRVSGPVEVGAEVGAFERPPGVASGPPPAWRLGDDEEVVVDLRVDADHVQWVTAMAGDDAVTRTAPDGSVCLRLRVTNRAAFRSFALGLLDHVEVVGPPEIREEMVAWLTDLARSRSRPA